MIPATRFALSASIAWFAIANTFGLLMGTGLVSYLWRPAHGHMNLLGFVAMMIYGVAYHALPRFRGVPFTRPRLAFAQVALANVGLLGMALTWGLNGPPASFAVWGGMSWLASMLFVALIAEVLWRRPPYFQSSLK